jgi:hypothetical protein
MDGMMPSIHGTNRPKITGLSPTSKVGPDTFVIFNTEDGGRVSIPPDQIMRLWNECAQEPRTWPAAFPVRGLPPGVKVKSMSLQAPNIREAETHRQASIVLEPDSIYGVLDLYQVPIPEGFKRAGQEHEEWFREARLGEYGIGKDMRLEGPYVAEGDMRPGYGWLLCGPDRRRIIVRKVKRVLVVEIAILEVDRLHTSCGEKPTLDVLHVSAVTSAFAEAIVGQYADLNGKFRIEERP